MIMRTLFSITTESIILLLTNNLILGRSGKLISVPHTPTRLPKNVLHTTVSSISMAKPTVTAVEWAMT